MSVELLRLATVRCGTFSYRYQNEIGFKGLLFYSIILMEKRKEEIQNYLKERINPILQPLTLAITKNRPQDIPSFCLQWLRSRNNPIHDITELSDEETDVIDDKLFKSMRTSQLSKNRNRSGVSAQVYGEFNKKSSFVPKLIQKSEDTNTRILILLRNSILFKGLDEKDTQIVIEAMEEKICKAGEYVIREGEDGNQLYIVDQGEFDCFKIINKTETYIKTYTTGEAFGELALLYNAPRAASIKSKSNNGKLFILDRATFNHIVKQSAVKKREIFEEVLRKVQLLDCIDPYERSRICDALKQSTYNAGDAVIQQGELGDRFFIVVSGKLVAERKQKQESEARTVFQYREGDYFGEIALVRNIPRQATVKALTQVKLVSIERSAFKRILGPIQDILKRNEERYKKFWTCPIEGI